jgi:hypothetical protein
MGRGSAALGALLAAGTIAASASPARADSEPRSLDLGAAVRPAADLYPGGPGAAQFTVGNPNPFPVRLLTVSFGPVHSSAPAACPPGMLRTHRVRLRAVIPAGATAVTERAPRAFRLSRSAPNGCQGVTFTASATVVAAILDDDSGGGGGGTAATAGGGPGGSVASAAASLPRALARTGAPLLPLTTGGAALALTGCAVLRLAARRRRA